MKKALAFTVLVFILLLFAGLVTVQGQGPYGCPAACHRPKDCDSQCYVSCYHGSCLFPTCAPGRKP